MINKKQRWGDKEKGKQGIKGGGKEGIRVKVGDLRSG